MDLGFTHGLLVICSILFASGTLFCLLMTFFAATAGAWKEAFVAIVFAFALGVLSGCNSYAHDQVHPVVVPQAQGE